LTDNIIVLDHFFTLTKKCYPIYQALIRLNTIFYNLVVAYFLGHPLIGRNFANKNKSRRKDAET